MDTLSELPPQVPRPPQSLSRGRTSKKLSGSSMGGGSKSERRLLMEAKAGVGAAIAEVCTQLWWCSNSVRTALDVRLTRACRGRLWGVRVWCFLMVVTFVLPCRHLHLHARDLCFRPLCLATVVCLVWRVACSAFEHLPVQAAGMLQRLQPCSALSARVFGGDARLRNVTGSCFKHLMYVCRSLNGSVLKGGTPVCCLKYNNSVCCSVYLV